MKTTFQKDYNEKFVYPIGSPEIEDDRNIILTQNGRVGYGRLGTDNIMAIGPAKYLEKSVAVPNILQGYGSYIVLDQDGSIYEDVKDFLAKNEYVVKVIDPCHPEISAAYNPFRYLNCEDTEKRYERILAMARSIVSATATENRKDFFWAAAEEALLQAVIFYLLDHCEPEKQNLTAMAELLETAAHNPDDTDSLLDPVFEKIRKEDPEDVGATHYAVFKQASRKTARAIFMIVTEYMGGFANQETKRMIDHDDVRIETLGDTKTMVFLKIRSVTDAERILANIMLGQIFPVLREQAEKEHQIPLKLPVHLILNAFTFIGEIPGFRFAQTVMHHYGLSSILMLRSIDQLRQCYGDQWDLIASTCYATVYFRGAGDAELYERESRTYGRKAIQGFRFIAESTGFEISKEGERVPLFTPEEIKQIECGHAICMIAGYDPVDDMPYDPKMHPSCRKNA